MTSAPSSRALNGGGRKDSGTGAIPPRLTEGGGILHDLGAHLIDQAIQLFGPVQESYGETANHGPHPEGADTEAFVSLLHESGVRSRLWMNGMAARVGPRFHVLGSKAGYTKWGLDSQEPALAAGMTPSDPAYGVDPQDSWGVLGIDGDATPVPAERGDYPAFYVQLAAALRGQGPLPVNPPNPSKSSGSSRKSTPSRSCGTTPREPTANHRRKGRRMSSTASSKRVAVIGGGILGVSTAVHLLRQGASVVLLTERGLASEATGRSLSWLNSAGERSTPYHQLRLAGVDRYRTLFAADPGREWLQFGGGLMWNAAGQRAATEARHAYEKSIGYDSKLLAPEEIAAVTPGIDPVPCRKTPSSIPAKAGSACRTWWTS